MTVPLMLLQLILAITAPILAPLHITFENLGLGIMFLLMASEIRALRETLPAGPTRRPSAMSIRWYSPITSGAGIVIIRGRRRKRRRGGGGGEMRPHVVIQELFVWEGGLATGVEQDELGQGRGRGRGRGSRPGKSSRLVSKPGAVGNSSLIRGS